MPFLFHSQGFGNGMPNSRSTDLCSPNADRVASVKYKEAVMDNVSSLAAV